MVSARLLRVGPDDGPIAVIVDPEAAYLSGTYPDFDHTKLAEYQRWVSELESRQPTVPVFHFDTFDESRPGHGEHWTHAIDQAGEQTTGSIVVVRTHPNSDVAAGIAGSRFADRITSVLQPPINPGGSGRLMYPAVPQLDRRVDVYRPTDLLWPCDADVAQEVTDRAVATARLRQRLAEQAAQLRTVVRTSAPTDHARDDSMPPDDATRRAEFFAGATELDVLAYAVTPRAGSVAVVAWGNPATARRVEYTQERRALGDLEAHDPEYGRVPGTLRWSPADASKRYDTAVVRLLSNGLDPEFAPRVLATIAELSSRPDGPSFTPVVVGRPGRPARRTATRPPGPGGSPHGPPSPPDGGRPSPPSR